MIGEHKYALYKALYPKYTEHKVRITELSHNSTLLYAASIKHKRGLCSGPRQAER